MPMTPVRGPLVQRESIMHIKSKIAGLVAILTVATSVAIPVNSAHARGWGIGAAILGGAVVGTAIAGSVPYGGYYVDGSYAYRCRWERRYDAYGFYIGTANVCRYY